MAVLLVFGGYAVAGEGKDSHWHKQEGSAMGTLIRVEFWLEDQEKADRLIRAVMEEMHRIDRLMSPYIESSELARINAKAFEAPVVVSQELFDLIALALKYGEWSEGAFDITFASVGFHYNYREKIAPDVKTLEKARALIDYRAVRLLEDSRAVRFLRPGVKIDLGGIAKGHAVDNAIKYLYSQGIRHGIVSAGGDSRIIGDRHGRPWVLGVQNPRGENHLITLPL
ncbi:MAG: FAD:protein FMN transferase, partial [Ketobacteraceae bacterium]|nr:FAD:protein FMN transferase [Ketobacteraceae bacterium]